MRRITLFSIAFLLATHLGATTISFTSSASFFAALNTAPVQIEDFAGTTNGQFMAAGTTIGGITYSPRGLTEGATRLEITNLYQGISAQTLGVDHTGGDVNSANIYFYGGEGVSLTFARPVFAIGVYFDVSLNSGSFQITTSSGSALTGSSVYDSDTLVFAGLISDAPFMSASVYSSGSDASFSLAEIATQSTPEPSTFLPMALSLAAGLFVWRKRLST